MKLECLYSGGLVTISPESKDFLCELDTYDVKIAPLTDAVSEYGGGARVVWAMTAGDREAEAQAKKGEEGAASDRDNRAVAVLRQNWCIGLRIVELIFAVIAIGLIIGAFYQPQIGFNHRHIALIYSSYSSFIIITGVLIIASLLGEAAGWKTSLLFSIIGFILFTATAGIIFYDWHGSYYVNLRPNKKVYDLLISSGVLSVIDAAVFLLHAIMTFKNDADF